MKKTLAAVLAVASVAAVAAPAIAQPYGRAYGYDRDYERRYDDRYERTFSAAHQRNRVRSLDQRIDSLYRRGDLSRGEAAGLSAQLDRFAHAVESYGRNGLTVRENAILNDRYMAIEVRLQNQAHDGRHRGYRRDW